MGCLFLAPIDRYFRHLETLWIIRNLEPDTQSTKAAAQVRREETASKDAEDRADV